MAAPITPPSRPADAPSISQTATGNVRNSTGQALTGASASTETAPAMNAMAARRQPQESTTACEARAIRAAKAALTAFPCRAAFALAQPASGRGAAHACAVRDGRCGA